MSRKIASDDHSDFVPDDSADLGADFVPDDAGGNDFVAEPDQPGSSAIIKGGVKTLQGVGKGLDYLRGAIGGPALATVLEKLSGKQVTKPGEYRNAINPTRLDTYPSSAEMMERAGVPTGAKLSDYTDKVKKDGFFDVTLRGAGGVGLDALTDPLTYVSLGGSAAAKKGVQEGVEVASKTAARKLLEMPGNAVLGAATAPSRATSNMGKKIFSWGITPLEQAGEKFGKKEVADTLYKHRIWGGARSIDEQIMKKSGELKEARDLILKQADAVGASVDRGEAFHEFTSTLDQMVTDRRISPEEAEKILEGTISTYMKGEAPSTLLATQWKSDVTKSLPSKVWDATKNANVGQALDKKLGKGLKESVESAVKKAQGREAEQALKTTNKELGEMLSVSPAARNYAQLLDRRYMVTPFDIGMGGFGGMAGGSAAHGMTMLAAKKALEVGRLPSVRTGAGTLLRDMGEGSMAPILDILSRRFGAGSLRKGQNDEQEK